DSSSPLSPAGRGVGGEGEAFRERLLALTLDDLRKWASKAVVSEMLAAVKAAPAVEVEVGVGLILRLVEHRVEARLLPRPPPKSPARLLDQILTTGPKVQHKRWVVAAVLALQIAHGHKHEPTDAAAPAEEAGAVLSRAQVLEATRNLLESMVATGLAHPSQRL